MGTTAGVVELQPETQFILTRIRAHTERTRLPRTTAGSSFRSDRSSWVQPTPKTRLFRTSIQPKMLGMNSTLDFWMVKRGDHHHLEDYQWDHISPSVIC